MPEHLILADWFRVGLITLTALVIVGLLIEMIFAWRRLSVGQRLFSTGALFMLLYVVDASREAIQTHLSFRWRLLFWVFGVLSFGIYLLEPRRSRERRFGRKMFDPTP